MGTLKDRELAGELADALQDEPFFNLVAEKVAELRGVPLTEELRREIVTMLRNDLTVTRG